MAAAKEIRTKIRSIQNTQKITKAMQMVAASKMRRAQERMQATRPYAEKMVQVIGHVAGATSDETHSYLKPRAEVKRVGIILVSTDRGLCGGLNVNLFKAAVKEIAQWKEQGVEVDVCVFGRKGAGFANRLRDVNVIAEQSNLGDRPALTDVIGSVQTMLAAYDDGKVDRVLLIGNQFVNTMTQKPTVQQLIPAVAGDDLSSDHSWDYLYEPSAGEVLDTLLNRYIESQVYQGLVENVACEMAARMIAMKSATDNAGNLISELQLVYNKARQAAITQEIAEIVGGAAALS
ncbi:MAG: F0F1 ATP synthase subunit gamma [Gammaproteobacteria bacterium]|nr:F0F1 ATP synthase subunit gamma [Gammaproteobacteria bacterium]